jgi:hypothetical protein
MRERERGERWKEMQKTLLKFENVVILALREL